MSSSRQIEAIEAEVQYHRDSIAVLRARLYRRGYATSPRLEELQRRLDSAQARLRALRSTPAQVGPEHSVEH